MNTTNMINKRNSRARRDRGAEPIGRLGWCVGAAIWGAVTVGVTWFGLRHHFSADAVVRLSAVPAAVTAQMGMLIWLAFQGVHRDEAKPLWVAVAPVNAALVLAAVALLPVQVLQVLGNFAVEVGLSVPHVWGIAGLVAAGVSTALGQAWSRHQADS